MEFHYLHSQCFHVIKLRYKHEGYSKINTQDGANVAGGGIESESYVNCNLNLELVSSVVFWYLISRKAHKIVNIYRYYI